MLESPSVIELLSLPLQPFVAASTQSIVVFKDLVQTDHQSLVNPPINHSNPLSSHQPLVNPPINHSNPLSSRQSLVIPPINHSNPQSSHPSVQRTHQDHATAGLCNLAVASAELHHCQALWKINQSLCWIQTHRKFKITLFIRSKHIESSK